MVISDCSFDKYVDSFEFRPFIESVCMIGDTLYYATLRGERIVKMEGRKATLLYDGPCADSWERYHFSIQFDNYIFFSPAEADNGILLDLRSDEISLIDVPNKVAGDILIPYLHDNSLFLVGNKTGNRYCLTHGSELVQIEGIPEGIWSCYRHSPTSEYISMWKDDSICVLRTEDNSFNIYPFNGKKIVCTDATDSKIVVLDSAGVVTIYSTDAFRFISCFSHHIKSSNRIILNGDSCLILPDCGDSSEYQIINIHDNAYELKNIKFFHNDSNITWTILCEGVLLCFLINKCDDWAHSAFMYVFDSLNDSFVEIPFERAIYDEILMSGKKLGSAVIEKEKYRFRDFLEKISSDND